jgi:hypothetical protein
MAYGLMRGGRWVTKPGKRGPGTTEQPWRAWRTRDLDEALDRLTLIRQAWGLAAQIRVLPEPEPARSTVSS